MPYHGYSIGFLAAVYVLAYMIVFYRCIHTAQQLHALYVGTNNRHTALHTHYPLSEQPSQLTMPPPLPPKPLGINLGSPASPVKVDVFIDPCCPFSKKIFKQLMDVHSWAEQTDPSALNVCIYLCPQPWHPQSPVLVESALAVQMIDETRVVPYLDKLFDVVENFYDIVAYTKSRAELHRDLAEIAAGFVPAEAFQQLLAYKEVEGTRNNGNETTQMMKWLVKYHRSCGVHVTPTCFVNNIEASQISSGWSLSQWQEFLTPMFA